MSEIGRRGFLGMAAASPVAMPAVMREAIAQKKARAGGVAETVSSLLGGEVAEEPDDGTRIQRRIAELRERRDGRKDDSPPEFYHGVHESINSLKSVSPVYKEIMREAARKRYEEQRYLWFIDNEIKELMGRAKILGIPIL